MEKYANFDLTGKVAVTMGGTTGIGRAISVGFAQAGADVVPVSRRLDKSKEAAEIVRNLGRESISMSVDATDAGQLEKLRDKVMKEFGHVDILLNSQGMDIRGDIVDLPLESWRKILQVNLESVFLTTKIFAPIMMKQKRGKVINIASMCSYIGIAGSGAYAASKGGVSQLTMSMALEWAKDNIQVNAIAPGFFITDLSSQLFSDPEKKRYVESNIPIGRIGETKELSGAAVFLASEASDYITGITIPVDGGFLAYGC
ncbi:MAG: glucose 1-dehydrogenase [Spirochaetes bacterium]|nr:glucose 1-dehydrogenase [Spirochaetota bacterium]